MDVKFLAVLDPNCRLNFPKSGKLVALLIGPDTLHSASILFIITKCGLHSHAGLWGSVTFHKQHCFGFGALCQCSKKALVHVFQKREKEHLFGSEESGSTFRFEELVFETSWQSNFTSPSQICLDLLKWVIRSERVVHKLYIIHLCGTERRLISLYSLFSHPLLCYSTSGTLTCSNSNNLIFLRKQCKATGLMRNGTGKSFYINDLCLFFHVVVQRKHLGQDAPSTAMLHPNAELRYKEKVSVIC